jgi:hypothetical protein
VSIPANPLKFVTGRGAQRWTLSRAVRATTWPGWTCVGDEIGKFQPEEAHDRSQ